MVKILLIMFVIAGTPYNMGVLPDENNTCEDMLAKVPAFLARYTKGYILEAYAASCAEVTIVEVKT